MLGALAAVLLSLPQAAYAQPRPSVVLIVADDLGAGDLGAYGQGRIRTPRIHCLAAEGLRFTRAYAGAPACAPSRCVLLTGLHGGHCPVDTNLYPNTPLRPDEITIARLLRGAGYRTGIVGKWGLGGELADGTAYAVHSTPWRMGFDEGIALLDQTLAQDHWPEWVWVDGERVPLLGNVDDGRARYAPSLITDEALAFLDRAARRDAPFFLYVATTLPHREIVAEEDPYAGEAWPEAERAYASMVTRLDADVGRIVDRIDALGLAESTLVILTSDNGANGTDGHDASFFGSSAGLRGGKRDLFEGGLRVPMIARWPGIVPRGTSSDRVVGLVDLLPTLAELAGLGGPDGLDGASIVPILGGARGREERAPMIWGCHEGSGSSREAPTRWAVRDRSLVMIERPDGRAELYDLATDPAQEEDLARARPEDVARLRSIREREAIGPRAIGDPILRVEGSGLVTDEAERPDAASTIVHLRFDGDRGAAPGRAIEQARSTGDRPALVASPANGPRYEGEVRAPATTLDGSPNALSARLDAASRQHLVLAPHPALAIGTASVTIEAWIRLASLGSRQWLFFAKPLGRDDAFVDLGVLVQAGDASTLATHVTADPRVVRDGRELAIVFGDDRLHDGPWAIVSALRIEDDAWHRVVVRIDVERSIATFDLDGTRDVIAFEDRGHLASSGPVLVGAHHDEHGEIGETLDGWIDELRLSRGLVPDGRLLDSPRAPDRAPVEAVLDLGAIARGSGTIERVITIRNGAPAPSALLEGRVVLRAIDDPRLSVEAPPFTALASGSGTGEIRVALRTDRIGPLSGQSIDVEAWTAERGWPARRSPVRIRIEGTVIRRAPMDAGVAPAAEPPPRPRARCSASPGARLHEFAVLVALALGLLARAQRAQRKPTCTSALSGVAPMRADTR